MSRLPARNGDCLDASIDGGGATTHRSSEWRPTTRRRRKSPPDFTCRLIAVDADVGDTVNLTCVVVGEPAPEVSWTKDDEDIQDSKEYELLHNPTENRHTLVINRVTRRSEGSYRCIAENSEGRSSTVAFLAVKDAHKIRKARFVSKRPRVSTIKEWRSQEDLTSMEVADPRSDDDVFDTSSDGDDEAETGDQWISFNVAVDDCARADDQNLSPAECSCDVSFNVCL